MLRKDLKMIFSVFHFVDSVIFFLILKSTLIFLHVAGWAGTLGTKGKPGLSHKRQSDIGWILIE